MNKFVKKMCKEAEHQMNEWYRYGDPEETCHVEIDKCEFCSISKVDCIRNRQSGGLDDTLKGFGTVKEIRTRIVETVSAYAQMRHSIREVFNEAYEIDSLCHLLHTAKAWDGWSWMEYYLRLEEIMSRNQSNFNFLEGL